MKIYQAHFEDNTFGDVRASIEEARKDLEEAGLDSSQLVKTTSGLWYTSIENDQFYGISEIRV